MRPDRLSVTVSLASLLALWATESPAQTENEPPPPPPSTAHRAPAAPSRASAEFVSLGGDWKFGFHGLAGGSLYLQDTPAFLFNGQGPLLASSKPASGFTTGADVRQSRFGFSIAGPRVLGATPQAVLEIDLFGLDSPGSYGEVSSYQRLRLAYAELGWENDILRFGQDHQLILGVTPDSLGHQAFPVTYFAGMVGWREPGIGYFHKFPLGGSSLELAFQVMKSDWQSPYDFGATTTNLVDPSLGQLSGLPGFEGRLKFTSDHFMAFAAGHYNRVSALHAGDLPQPLPVMIYPRDWDVFCGVAGVQVKAGGLSLTASGYSGQNLFPLLGEQLQPVMSNSMAEWGAWGQIAYAFTDNFDISAVAGTSQLKTADVELAIQDKGGGSAPLSNTVVGGMIRYQVEGFAFAPEFYHVIGRVIQEDGAGANVSPGAQDGTISVNQVMLSGMYSF